MTLIDAEIIKINKNKVIKNLEYSNKISKNKEYYSTVGDSNKVKIYIYNDELNKFINFIKNNEESKINIDLIDKKLDKLINALNIITSGTNTNDIKEVDREYTNNLIYAYLKIYNILKDKERNKKQGKGLKIIIPKPMLSRLPVLLSEIHAGNNSSNLKTK